MKQEINLGDGETPESYLLLLCRLTTQLNHKMPTAEQNISSEHILILFENTNRKQSSVGNSHARGKVHTLQSMFIQSKPLLEVVIGH